MVDDVKLSEINLFLALVKVKSVRELGRQMNMQPGQVSKWVQSLEKKVGVPLLERSAAGVQPTARALELIPVFEKMSALSESMRPEQAGRKSSRLINLASSSYLSTYLLPLVVKQISGADPDSKVRIIDLPPTQFIPAALRGGFDYCLHTQELDWPSTWTTVEVGFIRWSIYGRKNHPVLKTPGLKQVLKYPFVIPVYWTNEGTRYGDDQCPIPLSKRRKGHETATAGSAAEIVKVTDQLAFLPELIARKAEENGELEKVMMSWRPVKRPVYLSVKSSTVKQHEFGGLIELFKRVLTSL